LAIALAEYSSKLSFPSWSVSSLANALRRLAKYSSRVIVPFLSLSYRLNRLASRSSGVTSLTGASSGASDATSPVTPATAGARSASRWAGGVDRHSITASPTSATTTVAANHFGTIIAGPLLAPYES